MKRYHSLFKKSLPKFRHSQGSAPTRAAAESWDDWVALSVDQGGPTLCPMEGSGLGLRLTLRRVPALSTTELYA